MTIQGVSTPTPFGFGGWVALTKATDDSEVMMGDLVLLQEEVNPVMSALLDNGIEVTALHNHFFWDDPHVYYMHVHGMGKAADLAREVKPAFDLIGHAKPEAVTPLSGSGAALDTAKIAQIVGHTGEQSGARSEEHTSELQSHHDLVCRLLLEKKKKKKHTNKVKHH